MVNKYTNQGCGSGMIYSGSRSKFFIFGLRIRVQTWIRIRLGFSHYQVGDCVTTSKEDKIVPEKNQNLI